MTEDELAAIVRGIAPIVREQIAKAVSDLTPRLAAAEVTLARLPAQEQLLGELRERVAVGETRAPVPGPAGRDGADGAHGKDGADGLGFDDLAVEFDGDRTLAFRFERGDVKKVFPLTLPFLRYEGVYQQGKAYDVGDTVTWAGAMWHCQEPTITKPGESAAWKLCVNRGRDGKAGRDGTA